MRAKFSRSWKSSKSPRKQRKYIHNIPKNLAKKLLSANLSKELRKKYHKRNVPLRKGDKVKVMNGKFKGKVEKISKVLPNLQKVYLENIYNVRKDGTKTLSPIHPSNLQIAELSLEDISRKKLIERK
ncbi:MAG: 50S ribosomal protein L24 [Nanoarchaeota archaeon]